MAIVEPDPSSRGASPPPAEPTPALEQVRLLGVPFARVTEAQCVDHIVGELSRGCGGWVVTPNLDILRQIVRNEEVRGLVGRATLRVADGMPLVWASRLQGTPLPERVAGSNLIVSLSGAAARGGKSIFLLGGDPGTAEEAGGVLRSRFSSLVIAGTYCPPMGFDRSDAEMEKIAQVLVEVKPDIVYVALGCPKQERVIDRVRGRLPRAWWLGVGISFSFLCGRVHRAPKWMQRCGLEWVHRLAQEPGRLFKRYVVDDLPFAIRLFARSFANRFSRFGRG